MQDGRRGTFICAAHLQAMILGHRRVRYALFLLLACLVVLCLGAATFPASWLKGLAERKLSAEFGRPVTIATMSRDSAFSFSPVLSLTGVEIPQATWAGPGKLASIERLRVRVALLPALFGQGGPELVSADGAVLDLVRDANRRVNWGNGEHDEGGSAGAISFAGIEQVRAQVRYRDALRGRSVRLGVTIDPQHGLVATGSGEIAGNPISVSIKGPAGKAGAPWPFDASIAGPAISMHAKGTMAGPLDTDDMTLTMTARASDLKLIDRVIEAGLFGTQPVNVAANVRHQSDVWTISDLKGTIGTSALSGKLSVDKTTGRTKLDGDLHFASLDFADLSTDSGQAKAHALEQAEGARLVPDTRLNIRKIDKTDGRIAFRIDRITGGSSSTLRSAEGVLTLDHRLLVAKPFTMRLSRGVLSGEVRVDQRQGQKEPTIALALDLRGSSIDTLSGGNGEVDATVDGRVRLSGVGNTIREAVGKSDGTIGVIAHDGTLPAKLASLLGFDVGKGLLTDKDKQATLRCAVARLEMHRGIGTAAPVLVDTSESQTRGVGSITFPEERIALTLTGAPKKNSVLRLPGSISALGTIRDPRVVIPREVKSIGNVLKAVGRALSGKQGPEATDADCAALSARVLGAR